MTRPGLLLSTLCALLLCACAPQANLPELDMGSVDAEAKVQRTMVLRNSVDHLDRLSRVAWNVRAQNAELCGNKTVSGVGLSFLELDDYPKEQRELMQEVLHVSWRPTVFQVPPGSPGDVAGLRRGDIVIQVANVKVENKKHVRKILKEAVAKGGDFPVEVERAKERMTYVIKPVKLCDYPVLLDKNPEVNAYADGEKIVVYMGLMKFVKSDDELAAIVAHELAHSTQDHIRDKTVNAALGQWLVDLPLTVLIGVNPDVGRRLGWGLYSQTYEFEADYVGLYYTARAGYSIRQVSDTWRRMALDDPKGISLGTTHPSTSQRFVALGAAADEIEHKRKAGIELRPERKGAPSQLSKSSAKSPAKPDQKPDQKSEQKPDQKSDQKDSASQPAEIPEVLPQTGP